MRNWLVQHVTKGNLQQPVPSKFSKGHPFFLGFFTGFVCCTFAFAAFVVLTLLIFESAVFADDEAVSKEDTERVQRPIGEMRRDVNAFMKNSKSEDDLDLQVGGIIDLCYMHREIVSDPRFATHRQLQSLRAVAAARLKKYLKTIEIEKSRKARREKKELIELNKKLLAGENPSRELPQPPDTELPFAESVANSKAGSESSEAQQLDDAMYASMTTMCGFTGGPTQMFGYLSGNFAPPWDHGEELVDLIVSVINPDSWQRNGGTGIIQYYRPSRIIVVGASSAVQDDITNMLRNLRRMSR